MHDVTVGGLQGGTAAGWPGTRVAWLQSVTQLQVCRVAWLEHSMVTWLQVDMTARL